MKPTLDSPSPLRPKQNPKLKKSRDRMAKAPRAGQGPTPSIELYQKENCPFSHSVRKRLSQLGLDYVAHNVPAGHPLKHEQLVRAGGKDQIPFLIDHISGIKLYESQAIIAYLEASYGSEPPTLVARAAHRLGSRVRARADQLAWMVATPLEEVRGMRKDVRGAVDTIQGAFAFVRERVRDAVRGSKQAEPAPSERTEKMRPYVVRADVASVTDAA